MRRALKALIAALAAAAIVLAGVWVAGGLITDSFAGSLALTTVWFGVAGIAALVVARSSRALRWPVLAGYLATAIGVGAYLGVTTLDDKVVDEQVAVGIPAQAAPEPMEEADRAPMRRRVPVQEATGALRSGEHETSGKAALVRLPSGRRVLTLTRFATAPGPDLRVRLVPGTTEDGGAAGARDLGALKGNRGNQQYDVPAGLKPGRLSVVIWCRAFSATFGWAALRAS